LSRFPWLSSNIDFSGEQAIAPLVQPFFVREVHGEKVGIIGLTTEDTPSITRDTGRAIFRDAVASARSQVEKLTALGVRRTIVLSHLGYRQDVALASQVSGIDIIVGGHSHSLLVDREKIRGMGRLVPDGPYPTVVTAPDGKMVLVLQAWKWGHAIGRIRVRFPPRGTWPIMRGGLRSPWGIVLRSTESRFHRTRRPTDESSNPGRQRHRANLPRRRRHVETAPALRPRDSCLSDHHGGNGYGRDRTGSQQRPRSPGGGFHADGLSRARVALLNSGAVRKDLKPGRVSVGDVMEVLPFANTLVLLDLTGRS
jgi:5'-nucleotidase